MTPASGVVVEMASLARGSPSPKITWRRLDDKMSLGLATLKEQRLVLQEVEPRTPACMCARRRVRRAGLLHKSCTLTVINTPELTWRPQHLQEMAGDSASVSCRVESEAHPMVHMV